MENLIRKQNNSLFDGIDPAGDVRVYHSEQYESSFIPEESTKKIRFFIKTSEIKSNAEGRDGITDLLISIMAGYHQRKLPPDLTEVEMEQFTTSIVWLTKRISSTPFYNTAGKKTMYYNETY
jgi:hypothetical protein